MPAEFVRRSRVLGGTGDAVRADARVTRSVQGYLLSIPFHELDETRPYSFANRFMGDPPRERVSDKGQILVNEDTGRCGDGTVARVWRSFEGEIARLYHVQVLLPADRSDDLSRVLAAFKRVWLEEATITEAELAVICRYGGISVDDPEGPLSVCLRTIGGLEGPASDTQLRALIAAVSKPPPCTPAAVQLAWDRRGRDVHPEVLAAWNTARRLALALPDPGYVVRQCMKGKLNG